VVPKVSDAESTKRLGSSVKKMMMGAVQDRGGRPKPTGAAADMPNLMSRDPG